MVSTVELGYVHISREDNEQEQIDESFRSINGSNNNRTSLMAPLHAAQRGENSL